MQRKRLFLALIWILTTCAVTLAAQKQPAHAPPPAQSKLDDEVIVDGYKLHPPRNYTLSQQAGPEDSEAYAWMGTQRKDQTRPVLMLLLIPVPADAPATLSADEFAVKAVKDIKCARTNWKQSPTQKLTIGGLAFLRIAWSGFQPVEKRDMQGVLYVALDGDTVIEFSTQDVMPFPAQTVPLAEEAVHTFLRPPPRVFYSTQWPDHAQIYAMDPDGSHSVCLTPNSDTDYNPALSPDGKTLVFTTHRDGVRSLYKMNVDGTNPKRLTDKVDAGLCCWSADGTMLAFSSNRAGKFDIYVLDLETLKTKRLTSETKDTAEVTTRGRSHRIQ